MASVVIAGDVSGTCTLQAANAAGTTVLTLPTTSGTLVATGGAPSFTTVTTGLGNASAPSITFTGDTNTGIFSPTADTIAFTEGGVESMRIDASGNVGIGTSSPTALLHVNGTARANNISLNGVSIGDYNLYSGMVTRVSNGGGIGINSANASDNAYVYFGSGTSSGAQQSAAVGRIGGDVLALFTASTERMRIDSSGNVFVGGTTQSTSNKPIYSSTTAKAWVNFNGTNGNVNGSFNVSSVTRSTTGTYTINLTTAMANANYAITAAAQRNAGGGAGFFYIPASTTSSGFTTTSFPLITSDQNTTPQDSFTVCVAVFGL